MGISRLTAFAIQTRDDIVCKAHGPNDEGKWQGLIREADHVDLVSSAFVFDAREAAVRAMEKVVEDVRSADLSAKGAT